MTPEEIIPPIPDIMTDEDHHAYQFKHFKLHCPNCTGYIPLTMVLKHIHYYSTTGDGRALREYNGECPNCDYVKIVGFDSDFPEYQV